MSKESGAVKIQILDKEYLVSCSEEERGALEASAKYLSDKMKEIRRSGKVVGIDRIAVMAALNLSHELIEAGSNGVQGDLYAARVQEMNDRIEGALAKYRQIDLH